MYYLSLLWTIRWKAYAAAKVFEEMPTIITTYFIHDNYIASISLFEKKSLTVISNVVTKFCKTSKIPNIINWKI